MAAYQLYLLLMMIYFFTNLGEAALCEVNKLPPGLAQMQQGFDITKLNLFPKPEDGQEDGFKANVLNFYCTDGKEWSHPVVKIPYDLPNEIDHLRPRTDSMSSLTYDYYQTIDEYKTSLKAQTNASMPIENIGTLSRSYAFSYVNQKFLVENKTIHELKGYAYSFDALLKKPDKLSWNTDFRNDVRNLAGLSYISSPEIFEKFIDTYGTHYYENVGFGGKLYQRIEISSKYSSENNKEEIDLNAGASIKDYVKFENDLDIAHEHMTSEFIQNTTIYFERYGGIPSKDLANSNIKEKFHNLSSRSVPDIVKKDWVLSVYQYPTIMRGISRPLSYLISDDPNTSQQLYIAIAVHCDKAAMEHWKEVLDKVSFPLQPWDLPLANSITKMNVGFFNNLAREKSIQEYQQRAHSTWYLFSPELFIDDDDTCLLMEEALDRIYKLKNAYTICFKWHEDIDPYLSNYNFCSNNCNFPMACCAWQLWDMTFTFNSFLNKLPQSEACINEAPFITNDYFKQKLDLVNEFQKEHHREIKHHCCYFIG